MIRNLIFVGLVIFSWLGCKEPQNRPQQRTIQTMVKKYQNAFTDFGLVALIDNGKQMDTASIGFAYGKKPISTKNRFCIGSCTKMYTAVVILKLQEKGLLSIQDSLYTYLPRHPFIDSTLTIKQLLNHTSGLADFLKNDLQNEPFLNPNADFSDQVLYSKIDTVAFVKGSRYAYCNTNYFLLAKIIEKVTDKSWEMNIQELILNPLQLKNTFPYYANTIENLAHPIIDGQDLHAFAKRPVNKLTTASGNIVSDVFDLNTFIRALLVDKTLLSPASLDQMTSFYTYKNTKSGLGLFEDKYGNKLLRGHTGRQISYITYAYVDTQTNESMVVINNNANDETIDKVFEQMCELK